MPIPGFPGWGKIGKRKKGLSLPWGNKYRKEGPIEPMRGEPFRKRVLPGKRGANRSFLFGPAEKSNGGGNEQASLNNGLTGGTQGLPQDENAWKREKKKSAARAGALSQERRRSPGKEKRGGVPEREGGFTRRI